MANAAPAFQLYTKDFDTDEKVMLMTLEQEGAYFRLLRVHWREGSIPRDRGALAMLCRVPLKRFEQHVWPGLETCFVAAADRTRLVNPRMARDREKLQAFKAERSESGKLGNEKRWGVKQRSLSDERAISELVAADRSPFSVLQSPETATDLAAPAGTAQAVVTRVTWLTPYCDAWTDRWGLGSKPPAGEMAKSLREAERQLRGDQAECVARWRRFLEASERSQFARPARFLQGLGEWAEGGARASPGRQRGVTPGNVEAVKQYLERGGRGDAGQLGSA